MASAADRPWRMVAGQVWEDLQPFDGRLALAWRVALLCALVAGVAMMHKIPESAISCYLIIFLMQENSAECIGKAIGLIILASLVVLGLAPLIQALGYNAMMRLVIIAGVSFLFLYLASATQMGEIASIVGLVIAFILTVVDFVPVGEIATRGLLYAWAMACMPMAMMVGFCLLLGTGPHTLVRRTVAARLNAAAALMERGERKQALALMAEGQGEVDKRIMMTRAFHTAPKADATWLAGAAASTYRMLLAADALPDSVPMATRQALAARCRAAAAAAERKACPVALPERDEALVAGAAEVAARAPGGAPLAVIQETLDGLAAANGGMDAVPAKIPFVAPDALTNPDHQRYALKTTAAAVMAYLAYSLMNWEGIATAMVTCYVAALGTTGETTHKLALRICGCLIGAFMGILAILFVIPHLTSVGGLMVLVFCAILPAAWVSTGSERISYGGVQIGLAFLLTILNGFGPSLDMSSARDRIIGILLGNTLVFIMFTNFWPKSAAVEVRRQLSCALAALSRIATREPGERASAVNDIAAVAEHAATAKMALDMTPFEPRRQSPGREQLRRLYGVIDEIAAMLPAVTFGGQSLHGEAAELQKAATAMTPADQFTSGEELSPIPALGEGADISARTRRISELVAG